MTPEEKAKELIEHFAETIPPVIVGVLQERDWGTAKACAIICINEIMEAVRTSVKRKSKGLIPAIILDSYCSWEQVREAINKNH